LIEEEEATMPQTLAVGFLGTGPAPQAICGGPTKPTQTAQRDLGLRPSDPREFATLDDVIGTEPAAGGRGLGLSRTG
jgi:hypothetical protein